MRVDRVRGHLNLRGSYHGARDHLGVLLWQIALLWDVALWQLLLGLVAMLRLARKWLLILRGHGRSRLSRHVLGIPWLGLERGARARHSPRGCLVSRRLLPRRGLWVLLLLLLLLVVVLHLSLHWHGPPWLGYVLWISTHLWGHYITCRDRRYRMAWGRSVAGDWSLDAIYSCGGRVDWHRTRTRHATSMLGGLLWGRSISRYWQLGWYLRVGSTRQTLGRHGIGKLGYSRQEFWWR